MDKNSKFMVIGKSSMVVSAIARSLNNYGFNNLVTQELIEADESDVIATLKNDKPEYVFFQAGTSPYDFSYNAEVLESARSFIKKFLFIANSNIYPLNLQNPLKEESLLSGPFRSYCLYAPSHISGLLACEAYRKRYGSNYLGCVCSDVYGLECNRYDIGVTHIMYKIHEALKSNAPKLVIRMDPDEQRDYIFSEDFGDACLFLMCDFSLKHLPSGFINLGAGQLVSNEMTASLLKRIMEYQGEITFENPSKVAKDPFPLLDCQALQNLGWTARWNFIDGLKASYQYFLSKNKS